MILYEMFILTVGRSTAVYRFMTAKPEISQRYSFQTSISGKSLIFSICIYHKLKMFPWLVECKITIVVITLLIPTLLLPILLVSLLTIIVVAVIGAVLISIRKVKWNLDLRKCSIRTDLFTNLLMLSQLNFLS